MRHTTVPRLGPPPPPTSAAVSRSMKGNKAKDTKPEMRLRQALRAADLGGYRLGWRKAPGRPDISYPGRHVAIFVHGCYWHRCPICDLPMPKNNADFWERKFIRNKERDRRKTQELEAAGWTVLQFWECQIKKDITACVVIIRSVIAEKDTHKSSLDRP